MKEAQGSPGHERCSQWESACGEKTTTIFNFRESIMNHLHGIASGVAVELMKGTRMEDAKMRFRSSSARRILTLQGTSPSNSSHLSLLLREVVIYSTTC